MNKMFEKLSSDMKKKILIGAAAFACVVVALICAKVFLHNDTPQVTTDYVNALLQDCAELTTAKLNYTGMTEYKDTGIAFINKGDFIMVYEASARIGVDLSKVEVTKIDHDAKTVHLTLPQAEIQEVHVNPSSIKYFDESFSLFNFNKKEDANKAVALAEEGAKQELLGMGVTEYANENAKALLTSLLSQVLPEYEIVTE